MLARAREALGPQEDALHAVQKVFETIGFARVSTSAHEARRLGYLRDVAGIMNVEPGPFQNHSDAELIMLEALVGREPPFMKDGKYPANKYN
jgi:hypothetical protein